VLEHVHSPVEVLECVRDWLSPGGFLFLSLPNADSLVAKAMGRRWVLLLREHLWYFSPDTISRLFPELASRSFEPGPSGCRFRSPMLPRARHSIRAHSLVSRASLEAAGC